MSTTDLVGPLPTIRFYDGTKLAYTVPRDTLDPRFSACTEHRPACECREAELAEHISELRGELKGLTAVARDVLAGHPTWTWENGPNGEREVGCMCTGCQIVRATHLLSASEFGPSGRDEVDGIEGWDAEWGRRWKTCTRNGACAGKGWTTRDRGHYHEHLCDADGTPVEPWLFSEECPF